MCSVLFSTMPVRELSAKYIKWMGENMGRLTHKFESTTKSVFSTLFSLLPVCFISFKLLLYPITLEPQKHRFFILCISITILLPGLFSNINQAVIIPNAIKIREKESNDESKSFIFNIYGFYILIGILYAY